jgi:RiboL-PSP-HEPN
MPSKYTFSKTIKVLTDCLTDPAVIDLAPVATAHNDRANMLRQGLAVLMFSTLETFIRERTAEALNGFDAAKVNFSDLSTQLQIAATVGALDGMRFQTSRMKDPERLKATVSELPVISKVIGDVSSISKYSFGYSASNISEDEVKEILKAFGMDDGWGQITAMAKRLGFGGLHDCKQQFIDIKKRRHTSAHTIVPTVLHADLVNSLRAMLGICIGLDILLGNCVAMHNLKKFPGLLGATKLTHEFIKLIFVSEHSTQAGKYRVYKEQPSPPAPQLTRLTIKVFDAEQDAITFASTYAAANGNHVVVLDRHGAPSDW